MKTKLAVKSKSFLPNIKQAIVCFDGGDCATGIEYLQKAIALTGDDDEKKLCASALHSAQKGRSEDAGDAASVCRMAVEAAKYNACKICDTSLRDLGLALLRLGEKPVKSKTNHTPGPWVNQAADHESKDAGRFWIVAAGQGVVPLIARVSDGNPQCEANERLIAAGPELLAAVGKSLAWMVENEPSIKTHGKENHDLWWSSCEDARAAIAKARGESRQK